MEPRKHTLSLIIPICFKANTLNREYQRRFQPFVCIISYFLVDHVLAELHFIDQRLPGGHIVPCDVISIETIDRVLFKISPSCHLISMPFVGFILSFWKEIGIYSVSSLFTARVKHREEAKPEELFYFFIQLFKKFSMFFCLFRPSVAQCKYQVTELYSYS